MKRLLVAGELAVFWVEVGAPKVKGFGVGAGVPMVLEAPLVVPNMPPLGVKVEVPNMPELEVANMPPEADELVVSYMLMLPEGVELAVPNMPPGDAELVVLFCARPPKGLLCCWNCWLLPNIDAAPPNAGVPPLPFVAGAFGVDCANGFALAPPDVKLKPVDDGGCGLNAVPWLFAPNAGAGKDAAGLPKALFGPAGCGGKLLPLKPPKAFAPLLVGAGVEAAKFALFCCGAPKFALCARPCARALAKASSLRRISRRPVGVNLFDDMFAQWLNVWLRASICCGGRGTYGRGACWASFRALDPGGQRVST